MKLAKTPFNAVVSGYKTIELRLNDKKRQALNVGDFIKFTCVSDSGMTVSKKIRALHRFSSFEKLYKNLPLLSCGYTPFTFPYANAEDMNKYYPPEEQAEYGVVGIELESEPLQRFLVGQTGVMPNCSGYDTALREIQSGQKQTHWIWYVFPQIKGLTSDPVTEYYAVTLEEAKAILEHPVLRSRLTEISTALLDVDAFDLVSVFSMLDAFKLRASITLFNRISGGNLVFQQVLDKYCLGVEDSFTNRIMDGSVT